MMHQGNWKCSGCGGAITELPFMPRSEAGLTCRACYAKSKGGASTPVQAPAQAHDFSTEAPDIPDFAEVAGEPAPSDDDLGLGAVPVTGERPRFTGEWECSQCGAPINSLPFAPRNTDNLKCLDCFKKSKG